MNGQKQLRRDPRSPDRARSTGRIRIMIVDDHEVIRHGLREALKLEADMEVVGEAGSGADAVRLAAELQPDVLLLDVKLADLDGPEVCERVLSVAPQTAVIMLTSYLQDGVILRSLTAGASEVQVEGSTVGDVLADLEAKHPGFAERLLDDDGGLRRFVNVFVADDDVRFLEALATPVPDGETVSIIPAVAGG